MMGRKGSVYRCIKKKRYTSTLKNANEARKKSAKKQFLTPVDVENIDMEDTIPAGDIPSSSANSSNRPDDPRLPTLDEMDTTLTIEIASDNSTEADCVVQGRRIIDFQFFLNQLFDIENHNEKFGCKLNNMKLVKEKQNGLMSTFHFNCRMCGSTFKIKTCNDTEPKFDVNAGAVSGAILTGIGLSSLNELNASMDLPSMPFRLFSTTHDDVAEIWRITAEKTMQEAAKEEREAAISVTNLHLRKYWKN